MKSDPFAALPGYALRRAANAMMGELSALLGAGELRIADASVLILLGADGSLTSSEIGRKLDIQRANMVPLLQRLESAGLIARQPLDRKSQAITLTPKGTARLAWVRRVTDDFEATLLARIPAEHRDHLLPALNALWQPG